MTKRKEAFRAPVSSFGHWNFEHSFEFRILSFEFSRLTSLPPACRYMNTDRTSVGGSMMQASDRGQHCPFLNRADSRCGSHFTLERLEHAFAFCFDRYTACPVYLELLVERRVRRGETMEAMQDGASHDRRPLVEITVHAQRPPQIAARIGAAAPNRAA